MKDDACSWTVGNELCHLPSYLCKTIYFHFLRSKRFVWWYSTKDLMNIALQELFALLRKSIEDRDCRSFFIPGLNIIDWNTIPCEVLDEMIIKCEILSESPLQFLPLMSQHDVQCLAANIDCLTLYIKWEKYYLEDEISDHDIGELSLSREVKILEELLMSRLQWDKSVITERCDSEFMKYFRQNIGFLYAYQNLLHDDSTLAAHLPRARAKFCLEVYNHVFLGDSIVHTNTAISN